MILLTGGESGEFDQSFGGKADALLKLSRSFLVPEFCILHPLFVGDDSIPSDAFSTLQHRLGDGPLAVRSSASVEDQASHSYAGMFETLLGVDLEGLPSAVATVVQSASSARVSAYQQMVEDSEQPSEITMTVVVQRLLDADRAGVCLTWRSASSDDLMVEAVLGLGELLVAGGADPDCYSVNRRTMHVTTEHTACQPVARRLTSTGVRDVPVSPFDRRAPKLLEDEVLEVAQLSLKVEATAGYGPCDVEWAYADGRLYLLQARPYAGLNPSLSA